MINKQTCMMNSLSGTCFMVVETGISQFHEVLNITVQVVSLFTQ